MVLCDRCGKEIKKRYRIQIHGQNGRLSDTLIEFESNIHFSTTQDVHFGEVDSILLQEYDCVEDFWKIIGRVVLNNRLSDINGKEKEDKGK